MGPITLHALVGISKRLLTSTSKQHTNDKSKTSFIRPFTSLLSLTGYATALFFLPIHFLVHRDYPALPDEPIASVGPSSLDYEYVKYGLRTWPWRSWFLYAGLVGSVALHAADGTALVWNTWFGGGWSKLSRKTRRSVLVCGVVVPVVLGLVAIAREPPMVMSFLESRYHAAYTQSSIFQM